MRHTIPIALCVLMLSAGAAAQVSSLLPFENQTMAVPNGPTLTSLSIYTGVYDLNGLTPAGPLGAMAVGGGAADIGWFVSGRQNQAFADYSLGYDANTKFSQISGMAQTLTFGVQAKLSPRTTLILDGSGESAKFGSFLFEPSSSLLAAGGGGTVGELGGSPTEPVSGGGVTNSPLSLALYSDKRRDATASARVIFAKSTRTTWFASGQFQRLLPSTVSSVPAEGISYGGVTDANASIGVTYNLSRRTLLDGELGYSRSYWTGTGEQTGSMRVGISRNLSRQWFGRLYGGYGEMAYFSGPAGAPRSGTIEGGASLGVRMGDNTLAFSGGRAVADSYGLGASHSIFGQFAWHWSRPASPWTFSAGLSYERLSQTTYALIEGWLGEVTASRRIARQFSVTFLGTYSTSYLSATDFASLQRRGARLTLAWTPGRARNDTVRATQTDN